MKPLLVRTQQEQGARATGWLCAVFFFLAFVGASSAGAWWPALEFACFFGLGIFLIASNAEAEIGVDSQGMWLADGSQRHEISWSEVTKIESACDDLLSSNSIVLRGAGKSLALPGPTLWQEPGREEVARFIESQIGAWNIAREVGAAPTFRVSKNTRVSRETRQPPLSS